MFQGQAVFQLMVFHIPEVEIPYLSEAYGSNYRTVSQLTVFITVPRYRIVAVPVQVQQNGVEPVSGMFFDFKLKVQQFRRPLVDPEFISAQMVIFAFVTIPGRTFSG
jgi:hypothetical protein